MIGRTVSHYLILERIGSGGMGVVYKARDIHLGRCVAIKVLPPERAADAVRLQRFIQEAKSASALNHPNIITVHDLVEEEDLRFIVMEYVPGQTLGQLIGREGLSPEVALKHALAIADALSKAHTAGIVHRDLKPSNVMVREDGLLKVLDFGLAKLIDAGASGSEAPTCGMVPLSTEELAVGTIGYMSPEQIEGKHIDCRSDIFSFGALLYEMITGRRAFEGNSDLAVLASILQGPVPPLAGFPGGLAAILERCLCKNPAQRFPSATELKAALEALPPGALREPGTASIAVLPFANLGGDIENEYFSDGLAEELINALTQLPGLRVTARTSAFAFKGKAQDVREIGAGLNVDYVLEGSVRKAGCRIRVTAQLVKTADGYHLWSERFDRELTDVFAVQDEITAAVVNKLRIGLAGDQLPARRRPGNLAAYDLYLKGMHQFYRLTGESMLRSKRYLEEAIALDPGLAQAYIGLVAVYNAMAMVGLLPPREALLQMRMAALKALEEDKTLGDPHAALGLLHATLEYDWPQVDREFRLARDCEQSSGFCRHSYALFVLAPTLRLDEAESELRGALELDPLSPYYHSYLGLLLCWQRRTDQAIEQLQKTLELDPYYHMTYTMLGITYLTARMFEPAIDSLEQSVQLGGRACHVLGFLGAAYAQAGRSGEARQLMTELLAPSQHAYLSPIAVAHICLGLGEIDQALAWLEKAIEEREPRMLWLKPSLLYDPCRSDPRYRILLGRMNLE